VIFKRDSLVEEKLTANVSTGATSGAVDAGTWRYLQTYLVPEYRREPTGREITADCAAQTVMPLGSGLRVTLGFKTLSWQI
jgi:hypothetical protein